MGAPVNSQALEGPRLHGSPPLRSGVCHRPSAWRGGPPRAAGCLPASRTKSEDSAGPDQIANSARAGLVPDRIGDSRGGGPRVGAAVRQAPDPGSGLGVVRVRVCPVLKIKDADQARPRLGADSAKQGPGELRTWRRPRPAGTQTFLDSKPGRTQTFLKLGLYRTRTFLRPRLQREPGSSRPGPTKAQA